MPDGPFQLGSPVWPGVAKLIEEAGEALQVLGKLIATGGAINHWDGSDLRERLIEELGDLSAAIEVVQILSLAPHESVRVSARMSEKRRTFLDWHDEQRGDRRDEADR